MNIARSLRIKSTFLPILSRSFSVSSCRSEKNALNYKDALNLDGQLNEDEILIRDQFKNYCQEQLMPRVLEANRNESKVLKKYYLETYQYIWIFFSFS